MFKIDQLFRLSLCLMIVLLFLAASEKLEVRTLVDEPDVFLNEPPTISSPVNALHQIKKNGQAALCFTFSYPVWIVFPNGDEKSVRSDDELFTVLDKWENVYQVKNEYPALRMPFLLLPDQFGYTFIRTEEKLKEIINDCYRKN